FARFWRPMPSDKNQKSKQSGDDTDEVQARSLDDARVHPSTDAPQNAAAPKYDKERREARYRIPFEIEVSGIDRDGRIFRQETQTHSVSAWGCGFFSATPLKKGDIISIRVLSGPGKQSGFTPQLPYQVVHVQRKEQNWEVGAVKMEEGEMWGADLKS